MDVLGVDVYVMMDGDCSTELGWGVQGYKIDWICLTEDTEIGESTSVWSLNMIACRHFDMFLSF